MTEAPWLPEPVRTRRLVLRPAGVETDREVVFSLLTDPQVREFLGGPLAADVARDAVCGPMGRQWGSFLAEVADGGSAHGAVVGGCSLSRDRGELEISYVLLPAHRGRGYAREAVEGVLSWAAATLEDDQVVAVTQVANVRSVHLLEQIGFAGAERFVQYDADQVLLRRSLRSPG